MCYSICINCECQKLNLMALKSEMFKSNAKLKCTKVCACNNCENNVTYDTKYAGISDKDVHDYNDDCSKD